MKIVLTNLIFLTILLIFSCNSNLKINPQELFKTTLLQNNPHVLLPKTIMKEKKMIPHVILLEKTIVTQSIANNQNNLFEITGPCNSNICPAPMAYCSTANICTYNI